MILSVLSYLTQRASDAVLNGTEKTSIDKSITTLKSRLDVYFGDKLKTHFRFGSSTRGTILPRSLDEHSDIDYMLVFKRPKTGEVVHYLRCLDKVEILPKLAKKQIHRMNDMEGWYHVKENVRPEVKVEVEFRLLSYEIIDTDPNVEK